MFPKAINMKGVGVWGRSPTEAPTVLLMTKHLEILYHKFGFKFTLLIMNEYIDLFYPVKR